MDSQEKQVLREQLRLLAPGMTVETDVPMAEHTTLRLGGPADVLAQPRSAQDVTAALDAAHRAGVSVTVVGRGSNLLVLDGGIRGLTLLLGPAMSRVERQGNRLYAQAGVSLAALSAAAAREGLAGLAFASGIPGTLGGAVYMNAGAYGGEMSQAVTRVSGVRLRDGGAFTLEGGELGFGYRSSALQGAGLIVTDVALDLKEGDPEAIRAEMAELNRRRAEKQPLDKPSAGSAFKRPAEGYASQMIDSCGLKGYSVGRARVSEKHAGFLVNEGDSAADFLALMRKVQAIVEERVGVRLESEIQIVGE